MTERQYRITGRFNMMGNDCHVVEFNDGDGWFRLSDKGHMHVHLADREVEFDKFKRQKTTPPTT